MRGEHRAEKRFIVGGAKCKMPDVDERNACWVENGTSSFFLNSRDMAAWKTILLQNVLICCEIISTQL
jgi:hypothetical protein